MSLNTNTIEAFLEAMNIIAKKNVDEISYDTTIECQIVDNSEAKKTGRYIVSNGVSKFDAYSEKTSYSKDAWVRVLIPGGDYSKTKYIEGPVSADEKNQPITYLSAMNTVLDIVDLVKINNAQLKNPIGLTANGDKKSIVIFDFNIDENLWLNDLYSSLFIEADFKSLLNQSNIISGNYGVKITVFVKINDSIIRPKEFYFDSQEFFGNPYKFSIYSNQAKVFDIKNYKTIARIKLEMYQDDNFYFWTGDTGEKLSSENNLPNLFINNIRLGFGTGLTEVQDNTVKLICKDPSEFSYKDLTQNSKNLEFLWYNKSEENKYIGFSDGIAGWEESPIFPENQTAGIENNNTITYDEIEFLKLEEENLKLISQQSTEVPVDKDSLQFSLDIEEISNSLNEIKSILNNKYIGILKSLKNSLIGLETVQKDLDEIIKKINNMILKELNVLINGGKYTIDETTNLTSFLNYYKNLLAYVAFAYNSYATEPENDLLEIIRQFPADSLIAPNAAWSIQYFQILSNLIKNWNEQIIVLENLKNLLKKNYKNYYRYWEKYSFQITEICSVIETRILNILNKYPSSIITEDSGLKFKREKSGDEIVLNISLYKLIIEENDTLKTLENKIKENEIGEEIILSYSNYDSQQRTVWEPKDLSVFDNLYCIYWYQYEKDYINEDDPFGQLHWKKIDKWYTEYKLEDIVDVNSGETIKVYQGVGKQETIQPNVGLPSRNEESKDGIYYWNSKTQTSDNNSMLSIILNPQKQEEKFKVVLIYNHEVYESNEIIFTNSTHPNNLDNQNVNVLDIENITNSQNNYLLYDGTTKLLLDSLQANLDREIKAIYKGNQDVKTAWENGYISWYCPVNQTQLDYDISLLESKGFLCNSFLTIKDMGTLIYNPETFEIINEDEKAEIFKSGLDYSYEIVSNENENYYKITDIDKKREILIPTSGIKKIKYQSIQDETNKYNGLVCFSKTIKDIDTDLSFFYKIKNTFQETNFNNTIICVITKNENEYENSKEFTFNAFGSNGTDYTIVIIPEDTNQTSFSLDNEFLYLKVKVVDKNGKEITLNSDAVSCEWVGPSSYDYFINEDLIRVNLKNTAPNYLTSILKTPYYGILKIKIRGILSNIDLETQYPITWAKNSDYHLDGATAIVYNSKGTNPIYDRTSYKMYDNNIEILDTVWGIAYLNSNGEIVGLNDKDETFPIKEWDEDGNEKIAEIITPENFNRLKTYLPSIQDGILKPSTLYIEDNSNTIYYPIVYGKKDIVFCYQPIVIIQNQYESSLLNNWNGNLIVDNDENYILSAMMGAGIKNSDNTFSGVLMGDVQGTSEYLKTGIGLYGFHRGGQSFGFNVDGTAFLGKSGSGRIEFDGNNSLIRSALWDGEINNDGIIKAGTQGMAISLKDGHIDAHNFKLTGGDSLYLNSNPLEDENYLFLGNSENSYLKFAKNGDLEIKVSSLELTSETIPDGGNFSKAILNKIADKSDGIYLDEGRLLINASGIRTGVLTSQRKTSEEIPNMTINMDTGHIDAYNFKLSSADIKLNSEENYFLIGNYSDGYLEFNKKGGLQAYFSGNSKLIAKNFDLDIMAITESEYQFHDVLTNGTFMFDPIDEDICRKRAIGYSWDEIENMTDNIRARIEKIRNYLTEKDDEGKYILYPEKENYQRTLEHFFDIDNNGIINSSDTRLILRRVNFWMRIRVEKYTEAKNLNDYFINKATFKFNNKGFFIGANDTAMTGDGWESFENYITNGLNTWKESNIITGDVKPDFDKLKEVFQNSIGVPDIFKADYYGVYAKDVFLDGNITMDGNITIGSDNGEVVIPLYDTKINQVYEYIQKVIKTNNLIVPTTSSGTE